MSTSTYFLHLIQKTLSRGPLLPFGFASLRQPDACGAGASVGYAAEYLTCGTFATSPTGFSLLMFMRILYHIG